MTVRQSGNRSMRLHAAIAELSEIIRNHFPDAAFQVGSSPDDAEAVILRAYVDVEAQDDVMDVVVDRMMAIQIEESLPIFVVPIRTHQLVAARPRSGQ